MGRVVAAVITIITIIATLVELELSQDKPRFSPRFCPSWPAPCVPHVWESGPKFSRLLALA